MSAPPATAEDRDRARARTLARDSAAGGRGPWRLVHLTLCGLVLAAIVHLCVVLAIPALSERDAAAVYSGLGLGGKAEIVGAAGTALPAPPDGDPATVTAVCGYDLSAGPVRIVARTGVLPMALTLHRPGGGVLYAITDRAAVRGIVEFVVMTEAQLDERLARDEEGEAVRELRVVSPSPQGILAARVFARLPSDEAEAAGLAGGVACGPAD